MGIAIIGCGISGLLTAYQLLGRGYSVELYDMQGCGKESSWAGGGILSPLYPWRYPDAVTELALWSQQRYAGVCDRLVDDTGIDPEWIQSGLMMLDLRQDEIEAAQSWAERFDYNLHVMAPDGVSALVDGLGMGAGHSVWMPEVAQVRNPRLLKALKAFLHDRGVTFTENKKVTGITSTGDRVTGIRCSDEERGADAVVVCSGAWSAELLAPLGIEVMISPVKGQMLLFHAPPGLLKQIVMHDGYYLIPRRDGRILVGSTLEHTGFEKAITGPAREELYKKAVAILPALSDVAVELQWAGLRPGTVDGVPYIGPIPGYRGLFINAGQYRNGVVTGLASAELAVNWIAGEKTIINPEPYLAATD